MGKNFSSYLKSGNVNNNYNNSNSNSNNNNNSNKSNNLTLDILEKNLTSFKVVKEYINNIKENNSKLKFYINYRNNKNEFVENLIYNILCSNFNYAISISDYIIKYSYNIQKFDKLDTIFYMKFLNIINDSDQNIWYDLCHIKNKNIDLNKYSLQEYIDLFNRFINNINDNYLNY